MGKVIRIRISGSGAGTDAPTVEDVLDQVRDWLDVIRGVEEAIADDGGPAIDWRLTNVSRNSPLTFECEAFPKNHAVNIDRHVERVLHHTACGLKGLQNEAERPEYFTDKVLSKARGMFERVTDGLSLTEVDFGSNLPQFHVTPDVARAAATNTGRVLAPTPTPYREHGSVEGCIQGVERDGHGRKLLFLRHRVTGDIVKCFVSGKALADVEDHRIADVFRNRRVLVTGTLHYKSVGKLTHIDAKHLRFLRPRSELPQIDDIVDPDFTSGVRSEDYLEEMRHGRLS